MAKNKKDDDDILAFLTALGVSGKDGSVDLSALESLIGEISDEELLALDEDDLEGIEFDDDDVDDFDDLDDQEDLDDIEDDSDDVDDD